LRNLRGVALNITMHMGGVWSIGGIVPMFFFIGFVNISEERCRKNWPAPTVHQKCRANCCHSHEYHVILKYKAHRRVFPLLTAGRDIYTF
jgi:hypothetical protein